jgi:hypothetical protein
VTVRSAHGELTGVAKVDAAIRRGAVSVPHGHVEANVNALVSASRSLALAWATSSGQTEIKAPSPALNYIETLYVLFLSGSAPPGPDNSIAASERPHPRPGSES